MESTTIFKQYVRRFQINKLKPISANEKLLEHLKTHKVQFYILNHTETKTSEESATVRGVSIASGAKAMIMKNNDTQDFYLFVISAAKSMAIPLIKKALSIRDLCLANGVEAETISGCLVGAVHPFGSLYPGIKQTFVDPSLIEQGKMMNFNSGLRTQSISMSVDSYLQIEKPQLFFFAKEGI